jgi:hypothetical protein
MITARPFDILWPHIQDAQSAKAASYLGVLGAVMAAIWIAAIAIYGISEGGHLGLVRVGAGRLIPAGIFLLLAFGISRQWRPAAAIAPVLFLLEQSQSPVGLNGWMAGVMPWVYVLIGTIMVFFVSGLRGSFAYWRIQKRPA